MTIDDIKQALYRHALKQPRTNEQYIAMYDTMEESLVEELTAYAILHGNTAYDYAMKDGIVITEDEDIVVYRGEFMDVNGLPGGYLDEANMHDPEVHYNNEMDAAPFADRIIEILKELYPGKVRVVDGCAPTD